MALLALHCHIYVKIMYYKVLPFRSHLTDIIRNDIYGIIQKMLFSGYPCVAIATLTAEVDTRVPLSSFLISPSDLSHTIFMEK